MPKLNHQGPENKGKSDGRHLGTCNQPGENETPGLLGVGMGKRRKAKNPDGKQGRGKRLKSGLPG